MIPGRLIHRIARRLSSPTTLERVVEPAIADLQKECAEGSQRDMLAHLSVLCRGYTAILKVIGMCVLNVSPTNDERRAIIRTLTISFALCVAFTGLLMLPPLSMVDERVVSSVFLAGLIPQALPLAIPVGLTFGIALGMARAVATRATIKAVWLAVIAASVVSFVALGWLMPAGNQAYRESVVRALGHSEPLTKGAAEMTFRELDREIAIASAVGDSRQADDYAWFFHMRFSLSVATIVLVSFLLAAGGEGAISRGLVALLGCFTYWALIHTGQALAVYSPVVPTLAGSLPPVVGAWLPNVVFAVAVLIFGSSRSSRIRGPAEAGHYR